MPQSQNPKKGPEENRRFITEKIVKQPLTRKQIIKRGIGFLILAAVFGAIAAVSFVITQPLAVRFLRPEPTEESAISIPMDELPETSAAEPVETEPPTEEEESEPLEEMVHAAVENYHYSIDDLNDLTASLRTQVQNADQAIVTVHSVHQNLDWFDNPVETSGLYAGVIIAQTDRELLILTREEAVSQADAIEVAFANGTDVEGRVKQQDTLSKMAVVSVDITAVDEATRRAVSPLPLGNSYLVREGDLIIAMGSPAGVVHSIDYGYISYALRKVQMVDRTARMFYSSISADAESGTFFINTRGELIGWAIDPEEEEKQERPSMVQIMGISDYKGILEDLTNGLGAPCIGIEGQVVTEAMMAQGMPAGIYVLNAVNDRPAYNAGIQNGDILTGIDRKEITSTKEFQNVMDGLECGQLIHVTVRRSGRSEYTELEFPVTVGAR